MQKPKMILFDYGDTLLCEPDFDGVRGMQALFPYMTKNSERCTPEDLSAASFALFEECAAVREMGFELHEWNLNRLLFGSRGIEFSVPEDQVEQIFWEHACPGAVMPNTAEMLDFLHVKGIRMGVISNIGWSSCALTHRLNRLLPGNYFEFVMTSADYMVRKPDLRLFKAACYRAALPPEKIWFCGDNFRCDVEAAAKAGMQSIWYDFCSLEKSRSEKNADAEVVVPYLHIHDWRELVEILKML